MNFQLWRGLYILILGDDTNVQCFFLSSSVANKSLIFTSLKDKYLSEKDILSKWWFILVVLF